MFGGLDEATAKRLFFDDLGVFEDVGGGWDGFGKFGEVN